MTGLQMLGIARQIGNFYTSMSQPICKQYGLNQTEFDVILFCANNPEQNTARDLCRLRGIKTAMASIAVDHLIVRGLLTRQPDPTDKRIRRLIPTEQAADLIRDGQQMQQCFAAALHRGISPEDLATFAAVLETISNNTKGM